MRKVSLFKDEFLWNSDGVHAIDENGFAKVIEEDHVLVEMNVSEEDYASRILPCINRTRFTEMACGKGVKRFFKTHFGSPGERFMISLTNETDDGRLRYIAFVVPSTKFPGMYRLKYQQNVCEHCSGVIIPVDENSPPVITFDDVYIPKRKKKTITKQVPVMVSVIEKRIVQKPVFNSETNRWELTDVEEEFVVEKQDTDVFDLYDKSGNVVGTHEIPKTKTEEIDVLDPDTNNVIYEDIVDENGMPVQDQAFNKRYINESGAEISKEAYETSGGYIVIDCMLLKWSDELKHQCCSS